MDPQKPPFLKNILVRLLLFGVFLILVRFAYVITIAGESCTNNDFCFFSLPDSLSFVVAGDTAGISNALSTENSASTARSAVTGLRHCRD